MPQRVKLLAQRSVAAPCSDPRFGKGVARPITQCMVCNNLATFFAFRLVITSQCRGFPSHRSGLCKPADQVATDSVMQCIVCNGGRVNFIENRVPFAAGAAQSLVVAVSRCIPVMSNGVLAPGESAAVPITQCMVCKAEAFSAQPGGRPCPPNSVLGHGYGCRATSHCSHPHSFCRQPPPPPAFQSLLDGPEQPSRNDRLPFLGERHASQVHRRCLSPPFGEHRTPNRRFAIGSSPCDTYTQVSI